MKTIIKPLSVLGLMAGLMSIPLAHADGTTYKCLDAPLQNIRYYSSLTPACSIFILSYPTGTPEPTLANRFFPYTCYSRQSHGPSYLSDSSRGQRCSANVNPGLVTDNIFAPTSFWYNPLPTNAPLAPNQAALQADFLAQKAKYYGTVTVNVSSYSSPVYVAGPDVVPVKVGFYNCQNKTFIDPKFLAMVSAVPIPLGSLPATGTDSELTVYQPSTDNVWELWKARQDATTKLWTACWGGKITSAKTSDGVMPSYFGTTATSLPFIGGQITAEELTRGEIKHAIGISLVNAARYNIFSYPAHRSDGNGLGLIAEGQRFRLDPTVNVDGLNMSRAGKIIAKAAQKYGFVVWDKAGALSIRAQAPVSYTSLGRPDPYPALFENKPRYTILNGFPWNKLQFMPINYGKP